LSAKAALVEGASLRRAIGRRRLHCVHFSRQA
jgi:hypothetical protein